MSNLKRAKSFLSVIICLVFGILSSLASASGQTLLPKISVSPKSLNFGSIPAGGSSTGRVVTIKNTGKSDLIIDSLNIIGTNASDFYQTPNCTTIQSGNSCTITVTFNPTLSFGKKSAIIIISSNDPKRPTVNVKILGNAPPPKISSSPMSVNFGNVQVGNASSPKVIKIKNTGKSDLLINDIGITGPYAREFSQTNDCTAVPAGSSCSITSTFIPLTPHSKKIAVIHILSNDPKKPGLDVKLSGNALSGQLIGPGDTEGYFPFDQGNIWNYQGTMSENGMPPVNFSNAVEIVGTKLINGIVTTVFSETNPDNSGKATESYRLKDANGIAYRGNNDAADTLTSQLIPYDEVKFPLESNSSFVQVNKKKLDYGEDLDGDGKNETVDVNVVVTVAGFESVTVQVGTFPDCVKLETKTTVILTSSGTHQKFKGTGMQTWWFSPGIGLVKRITDISAIGSSQTVTEALVGYRVDGQSNGIMPEFQIANEVAPPDSDTESPGKPSIGYDGTNYLVVSQHVTNPYNANMIGVIVSGSGEVLKTFDVSTSQDFYQTGSNRSSIAFDGTNYLVVFGYGGQIVGQRVSPSGTVLDGTIGFAISTGTPSGATNYSPSVAFDGTNYLVIWAKFDPTYICSDGLCYSKGYDIYGSRITLGGEVLDEFPVCTEQGEQVNPSIAFDGVNYFAIWRDTRSGSGPSADTDIYGGRITPGGYVFDPAGIPISTASGVQEAPQIVFDGINYFAVWVDGRNSASQFQGDIYGTRINSDGTLLDGPSTTGGIAINTAPLSKGSPSVTFDGNNYFVTWAVGSYSIYPPSGIYGVRVSPSGLLIDETAANAGICISGEPPASSKFIYPVIISSSVNSILAWVYNSEILGTAKDIRGVLIYPW